MSVELLPLTDVSACCAPLTREPISAAEAVDLATQLKAIADPAAMESALWSIRECAARAGAIPPAQEGPYANLPLTEVMNNITEQDLQAFLRYVKAYPGNYVSRSLKVSETFATWVVYGAPQP